MKTLHLRREFRGNARLGRPSALHFRFVDVGHVELVAAHRPEGIEIHGDPSLASDRRGFVERSPVALVDAAESHLEDARMRENREEGWKELRKERREV